MEIHFDQDISDIPYIPDQHFQKFGGKEAGWFIRVGEGWFIRLIGV